MELLFGFFFPLAIYALIAAGIASSLERGRCIDAGKHAHREFQRTCSYFSDDLFWTRLQNDERFYDEQIKTHEAHLETLSPPQRIELGP
jgi:hypothetical protein